MDNKARRYGLVCIGSAAPEVFESDFIAVPSLTSRYRSRPRARKLAFTVLMITPVPDKASSVAIILNGAFEGEVTCHPECYTGLRLTNGDERLPVHVILSVAKDLALLLEARVRSKILRYAQDDMERPSFATIGGRNAHVATSMTKTALPQPARVILRSSIII